MSPEPEPIEEPPEEGEYPNDTWSLTESMDWHVNRVAFYRSKIAETEADRDRMVNRYVNWCARRTERWRDKVVESEAWITYAHLDAIAADPKHPKTLHLPSGVVRSVAPRPSVVVEDLDAFREWVTGRDDSEALARWECKPVKDAIKSVLADGEVVPGVRLEAGERRVTISVEAEE